MVLALVVAIGTLWGARERLLELAGGILVTEDAGGRPDVVVVSIASVRAGALEAARLYQSGLALRVVVSRWRDEPLDRTVRALGVTHLVPHELALAILDRSGVPPEAVSVLEEAVDGTQSEVAAIARLVRRERPGHVWLVTARSHTARARWLLDRALPDDFHVAVRSAPEDAFRPGAWWHTRDETRELVMEYLRWADVLMAEGYRMIAR